MRAIPAAVILGFGTAWPSGAVRAQAPTPDEQGEAPDEAPWFEYFANSEGLTGDWWGFRTTLSDHGLSFAPFMVLDWSMNVHGGLGTEGSAFRHLLSINATLDLATALGWPSGTIFVDFQTQDGELGSNEVGDYQYVGSWDAQGLDQVAEAWFEYEFLDGVVRLKAGKVDANWEFAYTELGWEFVHGSAGYPATCLLLPTYPDPATSVNLFVSPTNWVTIGFGVYDGALAEGIHTGSKGPSTFFGPPASWFFICEADFHWTIGDTDLAGRVGVGGWHSTANLERFDGGEDDGTSGFTLVFDQMLWSPDAEIDEDMGPYERRGIGVFLQYDWADPNLFDAEHHVGSGVTWRGAIPGRDRDLCGLYMSGVRFSDDEGAGYDEAWEVAFEAMWMVYATQALAVQPYAQYIVNPGGVDLPDAVNIGVRVIVNF